MSVNPRPSRLPQSLSPALLAHQTLYYPLKTCSVFFSSGQVLNYHRMRDFEQRRQKRGAQPIWEQGVNCHGFLYCLPFPCVSRRQKCDSIGRYSSCTALDHPSDNYIGFSGSSQPEVSLFVIKHSSSRSTLVTR